MSRPRAFIWGASGHARVVADAARSHGRCELVGFIDELHAARKGEIMLGLPILGGADALLVLRQAGVEYAALGVGDCDARLQVAHRAQSLGFELLTVVHASCVVAPDVVLGEGAVLAAGVVVNPGARIGRASVLNTACSVDHDCIVGEGAHLSPGVRLAGHVSIGEAAWVGIGSSVIQCISVGARCVVGAGSAVVRDLPAGAVAYGVPARVRRDR